MTQIAECPQGPVSENTILLPSGDHSGSWDWPDPELYVRFVLLEPSECMMWMFRVPSRSEEKAILPASGDQLGSNSPSGELVIFARFDPFALMT